MSTTKAHSGRICGKKTNLISAFKQESGHRYVGQVKAFDLGDVQLFDAVDERLK